MMNIFRKPPFWTPRKKPMVRESDIWLEKWKAARSINERERLKEELYQLALKGKLGPKR